MHAPPAQADPLRWPLRKHLIWLLPALLIKGAIFVYFILDGQGMAHEGRWAYGTSDTWEFIDPAENLIAHGRYEPDHRMPGVAAVFFMLRQFLAPGDAADAFTLVQWLAACITVYALALCVLVMGASWRWFLITYAALISAMFPARLELDLMSDSLCVSALGLQAAFLLFHFHSRRNHWLVLAGLMLTWAIFLRPIYALLLPLELLLLVLYRQNPFAVRVRQAVLFVLPWIAIDGAWTLRNYAVHGEFHPLHIGLHSPEFTASPYYALMQFVQGYGENYAYWDPLSGIRWYGMREPPAANKPPMPGDDREPPLYAYAQAYNKDSLLLLRNAMTRICTGAVPKAEEATLIAGVWERTTRYRTAYAREKPFQYHVMSRLRFLKHQVVHSGSSVMFNRSVAELAWWELALKGYQSVLYWFTILIGSAGAVWVLLRRRKDRPLVLLSSLVLYGILINPIALRLCEIRYLAPTFQITILAAVLWCWHWIDHRSRARTGINDGNAPRSAVASSGPRNDD